MSFQGCTFITVQSISMSTDNIDYAKQYLLITGDNSCLKPIAFSCYRFYITTYLLKSLIVIALFPVFKELSNDHDFFIAAKESNLISTTMYRGYVSKGSLLLQNILKRLHLE